MRNSDAGLETALQTRLSSDLRDLRRRSAGRAMTVGELEQALKGRGFAMLVLLMALPSCLIPLPGLSTLFGIAICLMGIRIGAGQRSWLPKVIRQRTISPARLTKLLDAGIGFASKIERIVKPRMRFLRRWRGMMNLIGVSIASSGSILSLPLPVPLSNVIPAWAVVFLATGMIVVVAPRQSV
jgi:hypothetical protein